MQCKAVASFSNPLREISGLLLLPLLSPSPYPFMLLEYHILGEEGGYWVDLIYQAQQASLPLPPVHSFLGLINTCGNRNAPPGIPLTDFSITGLFDLTPYVVYILFLYSLNPASCIPGLAKDALGLDSVLTKLHLAGGLHIREGGGQTDQS